MTLYGMDVEGMIPRKPIDQLEKEFMEAMYAARNAQNVAWDAWLDLRIALAFSKQEKGK